ncbi:mpv17-like protein 2 isoform X2 [Helicoverpa zea]|uniref:mpv17-like protein 2 isoform X2 n=1 Tax=Helicoverpa zea TaxID=7113 RepID=UPI001F56E84D|nr:mpv17-like protein 2 isoform X2 [Helicoverpa zea]
MTPRRLFTKVLITYRNAVDKAFSRKYLLYTNILISMGISTCGDLLAQSYEVHEKSIEWYDFSRTAQMAFSGSTAGVICHHWYIVLDKVIIGRTLHMAIKKLLMDQLICSPIVILSFFATVAIFEDDPFANFTEEVHDKFWILYKAEWVVWPPAQLFNFYFLPTRFRVAYDNTISLGYDMFTSHVKHSKRHEKEKTQKKENLPTKEPCKNKMQV